MNLVYMHIYTHSKQNSAMILLYLRPPLPSLSVVSLTAGELKKKKKLAHIMGTLDVLEMSVKVV